MIIIKSSRVPRILLGLVGLGLLGLSGFNLIAYISERQMNTIIPVLIWLPIALGCLSFAAGAVETRMDEKGLSKRGLLWLRRGLPWQAVAEAQVYTLAKQTFITSVTMMQTFICFNGQFGQVTIEHSGATQNYWLDDFFKLMQTAAPHIKIIDEREVADPHEEIH